MKKLIAGWMAICMLAVSLLPISALAKTDSIKPLNEKTVQLHFAAWADPQVSHYLKKREPYLISSAKDLQENSSSLDALVLAGDITENSIPDEWYWVYNDIKDIGVKHYINATGNHDVRLHDYGVAEDSFTDFTNRLNINAGSKLRIEKLNYSYVINGYRFIVLGSELATLEEAEIGKAQLQWLDRQLAKSNREGKPAFVILHQPLKNTHGLPDTWGSFIKSAGSVGPQSEQIRQILNRYGNVILITGHLHTGFGQYTYQKIDNFYSVNLPSLGVENKDGTYNENGIGYMVEAYADKVCFRARNFDKGIYLPQYDITINLNTAQASLSAQSYRYNGKRKTPKVIVTDAYGKKISKKYYSVQYQKGRKKVGKYKVTVTFKGKYKANGKQTLYFTIRK